MDYCTVDNGIEFGVVARDAQDCRGFLKYPFDGRWRVGSFRVVQKCREVNTDKLRLRFFRSEIAGKDRCEGDCERFKKFEE